MNATVSCSDADARPKLAPIRRLTATEYSNTMRDLFPGITLPAQTIAPDSLVDGFTNNVTAQTPSALIVEQYRNAANSIASAVSQKLSAWAPCDGSGDGKGCLEQTALALATKAYRRPLTGDEHDQIVAFADSSFGDFGFNDGVQLVTQGILQAPQFLYRAELGDSSDQHDGIIRLTGYEVASRLSYLLWQSMPDQALMSAAASGQLDKVDGLEAQARRMLSDARTKAMVGDFHRQWLRLDRIEAYEPDASKFPTYTSAVKDAVAQSTDQFLDYAFWEAGSIDALLTDQSVFMNDALATVYGLPKPNSTDMVKMPFPSNQRAGILTQPGILASTSHAQSHSPILRGVFMRNSIMCAPLPPPPATVNTTIPVMDPSEKVTTRQHIEQTHTQPQCMGCHDPIDGVGFAFEHYDAIGRYVTTDNGLPVDSKGRLIGVPGLADQDVSDALDLASVLEGSQQVRSCLASQWFRYAFGRSVDGDSAATCATQRLGASLTGGGDMKEMLVQLIKSDAFRYRPVQ